MSQLALFHTINKIVLPDYKKIYSVFQYDQLKYSAIYKKLKETAEKLGDASIFERVDPRRILRVCYIIKEGELQHLGDENHIFRHPALQRIHERIYIRCYNNGLIKKDENFGIEKIDFSGISVIAYHEDKQAEIENTWQLSIKERLKLHIELLKKLTN